MHIPAQLIHISGMKRKCHAPPSNLAGHRRRKVAKTVTLKTKQLCQSRRQPVLWLDLIPEELCHRIATHVSHGRPNLDALHLAESSVCQKKAVMSALSYSLNADVASVVKYGERWTDIFRDEIQSLSFIRMFTSVPNPFICSPSRIILLTAPFLRRACILDCADELNAVYSSPSIREISVRVRPKRSYGHLLSTLRSLNLTKLELHCCVRYGEICIHRTISRFNKMQGALAQSCPNLSSLNLSCAFYNLCSRSGKNKDFGFWAHMPAFAQLRELHIDRDVPEEVMPMVAKLDSVIIKYAPNAIAMAQKIGSPVTTLCSIESIGVQALLPIAKCNRLRKLCLYIDPGAEAAILEIARSANGLRFLSLDWNHPPAHAARIRSSKHIWTTNQFCDIPDGSILSIVQALPELESLMLYDMRINLHEVLEILKHMGGRLKQFELSMEDQDEQPLDRIESIVATMIACNHSLERLRFDTDYHLGYENRTPMNREATIQSMQGQLRRVAALLYRLRTSAPLLQSRLTHQCPGYLPLGLERAQNLPTQPVIDLTCCQLENMVSSQS